MISFQDAFAQARPGHTFSNHTEFEHWAARWCDRCQREAPFRAGLVSIRCALVGVAELGRVPAQWLEQSPEAQDRFVCVEYRPPGGGGRPPRPQPEPDQEGLFARPQRCARVLAQAPERPASAPVAVEP